MELVADSTGSGRVRANLNFRTFKVFIDYPNNETLLGLLATCGNGNLG